MTYTTSQLNGAILSVDGRALEGGAVEIPPGARLLLDLTVDETTPGSIAEEVDRAGAEADRAEVAATQARDISNIDTSDDAIDAALALPGSKSGARLSATYAARWKPDTAYPAGAAVVNPTGDIVTAKTAFTSGATYDATNWNLSSSYAPRGQVSRSPARAEPTRPVRSMVSAFQSGHGWTTTNVVAGTSVNDTAAPGLGSQSATIVTGTANASSTLASPTLTNIDLTGRDLLLLVKVDGLANLTDLRFYTGDTTLANAKNINLLPVETGGSPFNYLKEGEWTWMTLQWDWGSNLGTPVRATNTKMQFRVQAANGTSATLHVGAVATIPEPTTLFPYGAVSFTIDDCRRSGQTILRNRLDRYGWAGTAFPIRDKFASNTSGSYLTLAEMLVAKEQSGWEIACHADTAANHDAGFTNITEVQVEAELLAERQWLYENGLGVAEGFAWPRGMSDRSHERAAQRVVSYGRGNFASGNNWRETLPPANSMRVRALNVGPSTTLASLQAFVDQTAVTNRGWAVLTFHDVVASPVSSLESAISVAEGIIDYIAGLTNKPAVLPMIEVMRRLV